MALGASPGGGILFVEPPSVVSLNNELAAARAEALAAEEAVLWELSGRLMVCLDDVEAVRRAGVAGGVDSGESGQRWPAATRCQWSRARHHSQKTAQHSAAPLSSLPSSRSPTAMLTPPPQAFNVVGWLDVLSAKARFGLSLGGVLPLLTPWSDVFQRRSGGAAAAAAAAAAGAGGAQQAQQQLKAVNWEAAASSAAAAGAAVHLRQLVHPLLLADHLQQQQQLERQQGAGSIGGGGGKGGGGRMLGTRRELMLR